MPFSSSQQKTSWKEGFYGLTSNLPLGNKTYTGNLLGVDSEAEYRIEKDMNKENISIITKYDLKSRLVGTYTLDWSKIECPLLTAFNMGPRQIFDKGKSTFYVQIKMGLR